MVHFKRIFLVVLLLAVMTPGRADNGLRDRPDKMRLVRICLDSLDKTIANLDQYHSQKKDRIDALRAKIKQGGLSADEAWRYTDLLYTEYTSYRSQEQFQAAWQMLSLAEQTGEKDKIVISQLRLVHTYLWAGSFKEAQEMLNKVDTSGSTLSTQVEFLLSDLELQYESGFYAGESGFFQEAYSRRIDAIADKIQSMLPETDERVILAQERRVCFNQNHAKAYRFALQRLAKNIGASAKRAEILGNAGFYNLEIGDTLTALTFMTQSAQMSLEAGSRQEPALRKIAESIYPLGEVNRAHRYISLAMDNAAFYGSSYRIFEASLSLPKIDRDVYGQAVKERGQFLTIGIIALAVLLLVLGLMLTVWRQNKSIRQYSSLLEDKGKDLNVLNEQLGETNSALQEANLLKSTYLERALAEDSMNISRLENLITDIERKVKVRQYDDIIPYIYRNNYLTTRADMLRRFDRTFLTIFPDFMSQVNSLMEEGSRFPEQEHGKDLPMELRILALMRLGIRKSVTIGEILNISDSTVRNYKTRIRNQSTLPNKDFDDALMVTVRPKMA